MDTGMNWLFLILLFLPIPSYTQQPFLNTPIEGTYLQDYFIVNYVDWSIDSTLDYKCGSKSYDGHQGTDFVLRNFKQMDQGNQVLAAANGIVTAITDSLFDRNKEAVSGHLGNFIAIRHPNKYYTYYGHLKKYSLLVHPGDSVLSGQVIAEVGSSGYSSDPHLHFELWYDSLYLVDPFSGACGNASSLWISPLKYIDSFGIIDHDFCNFNASLNELKERIPSQKIFSIKDDTVSFWMEGYGIRKGDVSTINWYTPQRNFWFSYTYTHPADLWYYYFNTYIFRPPVYMTGVWKIDYLINNNFKLSDQFEIVETTETDNNQINYQFNLSESGEIHFIIPISKTGIIELFDIAGNQIYKGPVLSGTQDISLPVRHLMKGIYVLRISNFLTSNKYKFVFY